MTLLLTIDSQAVSGTQWISGRVKLMTDRRQLRRSSSLAPRNGASTEHSSVLRRCAPKRVPEQADKRTTYLQGSGSSLSPRRWCTLTGPPIAAAHVVIDITRPKVTCMSRHTCVPLLQLLSPQFHESHSTWGLLTDQGAGSKERQADGDRDVPGPRMALPVQRCVCPLKRHIS